MPQLSIFKKIRFSRRKGPGLTPSSIRLRKSPKQRVASIALTLALLVILGCGGFIMTLALLPISEDFLYSETFVFASTDKASSALSNTNLSRNFLHELTHPAPPPPSSTANTTNTTHATTPTTAANTTDTTPVASPVAVADLEESLPPLTEDILTTSYSESIALFHRGTGNLFFTSNAQIENASIIPLATLFPHPQDYKNIHAIRLHKNHLVFLSAIPFVEATTENIEDLDKGNPKGNPSTSSIDDFSAFVRARTQNATPKLKLNLAILNVKSIPSAKPRLKHFVNQPLFLSTTPKAWQDLLPKIYAQSYTSKELLIRFSKTLVLSAHTTQGLKWLPISDIAKDYLEQNNTPLQHYDTVLSPRNNEIYLVLLDTQSHRQTFHILLCNLHDRDIIRHTIRSLKDESFFTISDDERLITTQFDSEQKKFVFTFDPLRRRNVILDLFSRETTQHTITKNLNFPHPEPPQRFHFNGKSLVGLYQEDNKISFWKWE